MDVKGKKVTVMGMARSGIAAAKLLLQQGARVTVSDIKPERELEEAIRALAGFDYVLEAGGHREETLMESALVVVAPGIPLSLPVIQKARVAGVPVIGEIELAFCSCAAPVIAVTGTKGKTTTSHWVGEMLRAGGMDAVVAGNTGHQEFSSVAQRLTERSWAVIEVSSFQLEGTVTFAPRFCTILNCTPDHLDRYPGMQEYVEAKALVLRNQRPDDAALFNADDRYGELLASQGKGRVLKFSMRQEVPEGAFVRDGVMVARLDGRETVLIPVREVSLRGAHNAANGMAAAVLALLAGTDPEAIRRTLKGFPGVEHRLEFVAEVRGVQFYNNSQGTNIDAVAKSLLSFDGPILAIMGGRDKGADFQMLRDLVAARVKRLILIGEAREKIRRALEGTTVIEEADTLEQAVRAAAAAAAPGDTVLLSPACASFDMFKNYEERGHVFKRTVLELRKEASS